MSARMSVNSFFFNSPIPLERRLEIISWVDNLHPSDYELLQELLRDTRQESEFFAYQEHEGGS